MTGYLAEHDPQRRAIRTGFQLLAGGGVAALFWFVPDSIIPADLKPYIIAVLVLFFTMTATYIQNDVDERKMGQKEFGETPSYAITPDGSKDTFLLVKGDDYRSSDGRHVVWFIEAQGHKYPEMKAVWLEAKQGRRNRKWPVAWEVVKNDEKPEILMLSLELTADETNSLILGDWKYRLRAETRAGHVMTLAKRSFMVSPGVG